MTPIKIINELPDLPWSSFSQTEIDQQGYDLLQLTDVAFQIGNLAICGFVYSSYLSPPWMWFALSSNIGIKDLLDFRRLATRIPVGTLTGIKVGYSVGVKFAELFGFEKTEYEVEGYEIFRRR